MEEEHIELNLLIQDLIKETNRIRCSISNRAQVYKNITSLVATVIAMKSFLWVKHDELEDFAGKKIPKQGVKGLKKRFCQEKCMWLKSVLEETKKRCQQEGEIIYLSELENIVFDIAEFINQL